jgi:hypothetical protein
MGPDTIQVLVLNLKVEINMRKHAKGNRGLSL